MPTNNTKQPNSDAPPSTPVHSGREGGSKLYSAYCLVFCLMFFAFIAGVALLGIVTPDREKSDSENRMLRQLPSLTWESLKDGSYMRDLETYMTDQFPHRDQLVGEKTYLDMLTGRQKINGVYLGSESYLFDEQSETDEEDIRRKTEAIRNFHALQSEAKCAVAIVPNSTCVLADKLPYGAPFYDQRQCLDKIRGMLPTSGSDGEGEFLWTDCTAAMTRPSDYRKYYRTDHHWTTRSAYEVFSEIAAGFSLDISAVNYEFMTVTDSFQGTLASSSGLHHISDTVEICYPADFSGKYVIEYEAEQIKRTSFFFSDRLKSGNAYEVFMGGNYAKIVITSEAARKKTLLLIKDSYANCMIPMLAPYYAKIVIIDPRYLNDDLTSVVQDNSFTHILFLYNLNTFIEDNSLVDAIDVRLPSAESAAGNEAA